MMPKHYEYFINGIHQQISVSISISHHAGLLALSVFDSALDNNEIKIVQMNINLYFLASGHIMLVTLLIKINWECKIKCL